MSPATAARWHVPLILVALASVVAAASPPPPASPARLRQATTALSALVHAGDLRAARRMLIALAPADAAAVANGTHGVLRGSSHPPFESPLLAALAGAHAVVEEVRLAVARPATQAAPPSVQERLRRADQLIDLLLHHGASAAYLCPILDALTFRHRHAMRVLAAAMSAEGARYCLVTPDLRGFTLLHAYASTPASGLSRLLLRAAISAAGNATGSASSSTGLTEDWKAVFRHLGVDRRVVSRWIVDQRSVGGEGAAGAGFHSLPRLLVEAAAAPGDTAAVAALETLAGRSPPSALAEALATRNNNGETPLLLACDHGRTGVVRQLLRWGADVQLAAVVPPTLLRRLGGTAGREELLDAVGSEQVAVVNTGMTCRHIAAAQGEVGVLSVLRDGGGTDAAADAVDVSADGRATGIGSVGGGGTLASLACDASGNETADAFGRSVCRLAMSPPSAAPPTLGLSAALRSLADEQAACGWAAPPRCALDALASQFEAAALATPGAFISVPHLCWDCPADAAAVAEAWTARRPFVLRTGVPPLIRGLPPLTPALCPCLSRTRLLSGLNTSAVRVGVGRVPYAATYGAAATTISLAEYMAGHMPIDAAAAGAAAAGEQKSCTSPLTAAGSMEAPSYVFDGAALSRRSVARADSAPGEPAFVSELMAATQSSALLPRAAHGMSQLMVGPFASGAMPHFHGAAANILLAGAKLWVVTPPTCGTFVVAPAAQWFAALLRELENNGTAAAAAVDTAAAAAPPGIAACCRALAAAGAAARCTMFVQRAGDVVYVPPYAGHAVLNLADVVAVAME